MAPVVLFHHLYSFVQQTQITFTLIGSPIVNVFLIQPDISDQCAKRQKRQRNDKKKISGIVEIFFYLSHNFFHDLLLRET
jgi:hypothetical protein